MMQSFSRLLITLVLIATSGWIIFKAIHTSSDHTEGSVAMHMNSAPLFTASYSDVDGKIQPFKQWQGKIILVNFWATWCPPCREEMPELSNIQDKFRQQDVVILGISTDDLAKTKEFINNAPVSYPILIGDMQGMELSQALGNVQGVLPYTLIIDKNGNIVKSYQGRIDQALVEQTLLPLLKTKMDPQ